MGTHRRSPTDDLIEDWPESSRASVSEVHCLVRQATGTPSGRTHWRSSRPSRLAKKGRVLHLSPLSSQMIREDIRTLATQGCGASFGLPVSQHQYGQCQIFWRTYEIPGLQDLISHEVRHVRALICKVPLSVSSLFDED